MQCARQGFSLGLTLLVSTVSTIRVESLLKLSVDLLEVSSSMKGQVVLCPFYKLFFVFDGFNVPFIKT